MGSDHVELMLEGHSHFPPMEPPRGHHYERCSHAGGRGQVLPRRHRQALPPLTDADEIWCGSHGSEAVDLPEHRTLDLDRRTW